MSDNESDRDTAPPRPLTLTDLETQIIDLSEALHSPDGVAATRHAELMQAVRHVADNQAAIVTRIGAIEAWQRRHDGLPEFPVNGHGDG